MSNTSPTRPVATIRGKSPIAQCCRADKMVRLFHFSERGVMDLFKECSAFDYSSMHKGDPSIVLDSVWCGYCGVLYHKDSV